MEDVLIRSDGIIEKVTSNNVVSNLNDKDGYAGTARFYSPNLTVIAI